LPSTRQAVNDPRLSLGLASETVRGLGDITHLHIFFCELPPLCGPTLEQRPASEGGPYGRELQKFLRRRYPGGCSRSPGDRRRARRDVRLRASSLRWTPRVKTSSHGPGLGAVSGDEIRLARAE
jgi:hypothetical protein